MSIQSPNIRYHPVHYPPLPPPPPPPPKEAARPKVQPRSSGSSNGLAPSPGPKRFRSVFASMWLWETCAAVFSLVCIGVIVIVLSYEDGKELAQWSLRIPPNAVVSFIATIAKSSFLLTITELISQLKWLHFKSGPQKLSDLNIFDAASRGPWGALKLSTLKHKNTLLASWAAFIVLAALLVDPALQLVFSFPTGRTLIPTASSGFPVSNVYNNGLPQDADDLTYAATTMYLPMQAAVLQGLFGHSLPIQPNCETNDCSWGPVTTLGVCSSCTDITAQTIAQCSPGADDATIGCNYTTTANATLQSFAGAEHGGDIYNTVWNSTAVSVPDAGGLATGRVATLIMFTSIKLPVLQTLENITTLQPVVNECAVALCAKTYSNPSLVNGTTAFGNITEYVLNYANLLSPGTTSLAQVQNQVFLAPALNENLQGNTTFMINGADLLSTSEWLMGLFTTGMTSLSWSTRTFQLQAENLVSPAPDVGAALNATTNLTDTLQSISDSMTEIIRTSSQGTAVPGQAFALRSYIKVQWGWLALPITLSTMSTILLIIVIIRTHKRDAVVWKSSSLALLFHHLQGWNVAYEKITDRQTLDEVAEKMTGSLCDDGELAFVKKV